MFHRLFINKDFFLLWTGKIVSQIGDRFYGIALAWWLLEKTQSPMIMGFFMAASVLPGLAIGPFAGVFIDRWNRRNIIILADVLRGILVLMVAHLSYCNQLRVWQIFAAAVMISLASAFFDPTVQAVVPQIVPEEHISRANSLSQMVSSSSMVLGPVLGAVFVNYMGFTLVFLANGISYLLSAFFESFIHIPSAESMAVKDKNSILSELQQGLRFIKLQRQLLLVVYCGFTSFSPMGC